MKVGLIGFGKAGKAAAVTILQNSKFELEWVLRQSTNLENRSVSEFLGVSSGDIGFIYSAQSISIKELLNLRPVDFIIDFSSSQSIYNYGAIAAERKVKIISAISHYEKKEIDFLYGLSKFTTVFWSPNITLGVNYLIFAAKFLKKIAPWTDIAISEEHFKGKSGISGTALKIAEALEVDITAINSIRAGGIVGKHEIIFGFPFQTVRLVHESISREAFGNGVLFVAENLTDKKQGIYHFDDILLPYFSVEA